jgi:hypothetical protein
MFHVRPVSHVEQELLTLPEHLSSPSVFSVVRAAQSLVFCVMFCRSSFAFLSFFIWPLCCLSFFDLRLLITPLVSSNSSYRDKVWDSQTGADPEGGGGTHPAPAPLKLDFLA